MIDNAVNDCRENLQRVILLALSRERFFIDHVFYGGTALRILFGLKRFSEDLDFAYHGSPGEFFWEPFKAVIDKTIRAYGFALSEISEIQGGETPKMIVSVMLKESIERRGGLTGGNPQDVSSIHPHRKIKVRLEIDTNIPYSPEMVTEQVLSPSPFLVTTYSMPDLFAGKMHAVLCRNWKNRVKGRDWFDMLWYLGRSTPVKRDHLEAKMIQSGNLGPGTPLTNERFSEIYVDVCKSVDFGRAFEDVEPFLLRDDALLWKEAFARERMKGLVSRFEFV